MTYADLSAKVNMFRGNLNSFQESINSRCWQEMWTFEKVKIICWEHQMAGRKIKSTTKGERNYARYADNHFTGRIFNYPSISSSINRKTSTDSKIWGNKNWLP